MSHCLFEFGPEFALRFFGGIGVKEELVYWTIGNEILDGIHRGGVWLAMVVVKMKDVGMGRISNRPALVTTKRCQPYAVAIVLLESPSHNALGEGG